MCMRNVIFAWMVIEIPVYPDWGTACCLGSNICLRWHSDMTPLWMRWVLFRCRNILKRYVRTRTLWFAVGERRFFRRVLIWSYLHSEHLRLINKQVSFISCLKAFRRIRFCGFRLGFGKCLFWKPDGLKNVVVKSQPCEYFFGHCYD
jgi:hypothetical protein